MFANNVGILIAFFTDIVAAIVIQLNFHFQNLSKPYDLISLNFNANALFGSMQLYLQGWQDSFEFVIAELTKARV